MTTTDTLTDLHRAILLDPADNTARLVYADCLQESDGEEECPKCEGTGSCDLRPIRSGAWSGACPTCSGSGRISNGYEARAEFIRVGVELAKSQHGGIPKGEFAVLRARERELLELHYDDWFRFGDRLFCWNRLFFRDESGCGPLCVMPDVSRGFVSTITLPAVSFTEAVVRQVFSEHPVTRVVLSDRMPSHWRPTNSWDWWTDRRMRATPADVIDTYLRDIMRERLPNRTNGTLHIEYPSESLAHLALSDSCVCWGRRLAGLPDLPLSRELEEKQ